MISTIKTVIKKEWRDSSRDRRSMTAALLFALSGPVLIAALMTTKVEEKNSDEPLEARISGSEQAPDLIAYLQANGVASNADAELSLDIREDFGSRFSEGRTAIVTISTDRSKQRNKRHAVELQSLIDRYSAQLGQTRLALRGVAPSVIRPIAVDARDLATAEAKASEVLGLLTIYFLLAAFIGSMAVSIDVSAGERERNSLEVLMAQPVSTTAVFLGKTLVASFFGMLGIALTVAVSKLVFLRVPLAELGIAWTMEWTDVALMAAGLVPLALLVASIQICLSMLAKTFKEASTYLNVLSFVPMVLAMIVVIKEIESRAWMFSVPLLGHQQLLRTMLRAEPVEPVLVGLLTLSTLLLTTAVVVTGGRMLTKERIIFGQ